MHRVRIIFSQSSPYNGRLIKHAEQFFNRQVIYSLFNSQPVITVWPVSKQQITVYALGFDHVQLKAKISSIRFEAIA